jgi:predicted dehydrogenase
MHKRDNINRREFMKGIGILPAAGALSVAIKEETPDKKSAGNPAVASLGKDRPLRLGLIGFGFRGEQLARALKFALPSWIKEQEKFMEKNPGNNELEDYYNLPDLNIEIAAVADIYENRLERGIAAGGNRTAGFVDYRELIKLKDIDAVIIAAPDHWHARIAKDAAEAGKHIYLEKCMTRAVEEAIELRKVVRRNAIKFQLGHQGRQSDLNIKAREMFQRGMLGKVTLIEATTNRNDPFGAWIWPIDEGANADAINWDLFQEPVEDKIPFSPERFFRWRCWWDYGTGMAGDLLTHDFDAVNQILDLGIPHSAMAGGGIYFYKDGREVPDVFHATFEYPDRDLSLIYSGTLASGVPRGTLIMGHDATMELGQSLSVWADRNSTQYKSRIESGIIDPSTPLARYRTPAGNQVDAVTSATAKYFADRGLMYTYRSGKRADTTNLHLADWLGCIRNGGEPGCGIEQGFQEAITAHMATLSYRLGKKMYWDPDKERVIAGD